MQPNMPAVNSSAVTQEVQRERVFRSSPFEFLETTPPQHGLIQVGAVQVVAKATVLVPRTITTKV